MKMTPPDHRPWPIPSPLFDTVTVSLDIRWLKPPKTTHPKLQAWLQVARAGGRLPGWYGRTFSIDRQAFSFTFFENYPE